MGGAIPTGGADGASAKQTYPESRVLLIITGGTICMQPSEGGLVPVDGFLQNAMAPRPSFNDLSESSMWKTFLYSSNSPVPYSPNPSISILEFHFTYAMAGV